MSGVRFTSTRLPNSRTDEQSPVIVKASSGPRYVVSYRPALPAAKLKAGTRVSLDMTTLTIMRILPREVDPLVYKMSLEDPGGASFAGIGGLGDQVRELREASYDGFALLSILQRHQYRSSNCHYSIQNYSFELGLSH